MMLSVRNRLLSGGCLPGQGADTWFDISQKCPAPAETFPRRSGETTETLDVGCNVRPFLKNRSRPVPW